MTNINAIQTPSRTAYLFNKVGLFDEYIAYKDGDYTDCILVGDFNDNVFCGTKYKLTANRDGYNTVYIPSSEQLTDEVVTVDNDYYVYSNIGIGQQGQIFYHQQIMSGTMVLILGITIGYMFLKGIGGVWQWLRAGKG